MLKHHANRETLFRRASEQAAYARTVESGPSQHYEFVCYRWKRFFFAKNTHNLGISKFKITSSAERLRKDRDSESNRSVRICRNFGYRSTNTVTTNMKFEVLVAYITRN